MSGSHLCIFDPHETSLPLPAKLPKNSPNWRSFRSTGLKLNLPTVNPEDVQDQLAGYCPGYSWTNCKDHIFQHQHQSSKSYPCTIFRLPLRTSSLSEASEIKSRPFEIADVEALLHKFREEASETMIFLRSVEYVCLRVWEDGAESPMLLCGPLSLCAMVEATLLPAPAVPLLAIPASE